MKYKQIFDKEFCTLLDNIKNLDNKYNLIYGKKLLFKEGPSKEIVKDHITPQPDEIIITHNQIIYLEFDIYNTLLKIS
jgi:hypothetical protein